MPLSRFRVLDLTRARSGPTAVRQFADWGAHVVMVEPRGEASDVLGARDGSDFQNLNRNKRAIELDLKQAEGVEVLRKLSAQADVLVENFRPGVTRRLGIDFDSLHAINPRLVYASISGFGQTGPYAQRPGLDQIAQGMGGLMSVTGEPGRGPMRAGAAIADVSAGLYCALGVMTALLEREVTGVGRWVQTSLLQAQISVMDFQAARWLVDGQVPGQEGNQHPTSIPMGLFRTQDGYVNIGAGGAMLMARLAEAIGAGEITSDPRFATAAGRVEHRGALIEAIERATRLQPSAVWIERLNAAGVPCGPVYAMDEVFADPQVKGLNMVTTVEHPRLGALDLVAPPMAIGGAQSRTNAAPDKGRDTDEVLSELGYRANEIEGLRERSVI
jgi:crotonobetainyl-CoA:carnitine CoA-transferase CaiB-like acyl-CoA transferase